MNARTPRSPIYRLFALCVVAHLVSIPAATSASGSPFCVVPVPIVEYRFNDAGTTATNTGSDGVPATFKNADGVATNLHGAAGSGVSGTGGDIAFDNSNPTAPSQCSEPVGLAGCGGRAEQTVDDAHVDALASITLQGWLKSSDPPSVNGNEGRLFDKNDGFAPPGNGGFFLAWNGGVLDLQVKGALTYGGASSSASYLSGNQWIFFAVTYDGTSSSGNVKFYRGTTAQSVELVGTATLDVGVLADASKILALGNGSTADRAFPGFLDNMRIFGSASTSSGVLTMRQLESLRVTDLFPVPIVEYKFNETGTTAASTGSDPTPAIFRNSDNAATDLHGVAGSGVSGLPGDVAFDNTNPAPPSYPCAVGLAGCGGRAEQPVDDETVEGLASMTIQGWFKSNDPGSVTGNAARLIEKTDGFAQPQGGGGYGVSWNAGSIGFGARSNSGDGGFDSSPSYLSGNQWIFFAVTYDGTSTSGNVKLYRGTSAQSVELLETHTIPIGTLRGAVQALAIGNSTNAIRSFPGFMDDVRVYGSPASSSGVLSIAQLESLRRADLKNAAVNESDVDYDGVLDGCDATPPLITPTVSGTAGSAGWYVSDVQTSWLVSDGESAITSSTGCANATRTTDTAGLTLTCSATSEGGTSSQSVTFKRDATPPTASATANPPANSFGWRKTNVTVSFAGTDALSGGVTCDPQIVVSTQGSGLSASGRCRDAAGNQSVLATASGINIDKTDPTASVTAPADGAVYNRNQVVTAAFSCGDALSTIASCVGSSAAGQAIDTSKKANNNKFTVTATDKAGNSSKVTVTYSVK